MQRPRRLLKSRAQHRVVLASLLLKPEFRSKRRNRLNGEKMLPNLGDRIILAHATRPSLRYDAGSVIRRPAASQLMRQG